MNTSKALQFFKQAMQHILDLLYPPQCAGCQRSGYILCPACLSQIGQPSVPVCQRCSTSLSPIGICPSCQSAPLKLSGLRAVSGYREPLRSCIHSLKYNGNTRLAQPLGMLLVEAYRALGMSVDGIVPVPLHDERYRQRGYNHAALLAQVCAVQTGLPLLERMLVRHRATRSQVGLKPWERQENVLGAFSCSPDFVDGQLRGRTILLIDDICTTGATLEACAAPLFAAGAAVVYGLVLARPTS